MYGDEVRDLVQCTTFFSFEIKTENQGLGLQPRCWPGGAMDTMEVPSPMCEVLGPDASARSQYVWRANTSHGGTGSTVRIASFGTRIGSGWFVYMHLFHNNTGYLRIPMLEFLSTSSHSILDIVSARDCRSIRTLPDALRAAFGPGFAAFLSLAWKISLESSLASLASTPLPLRRAAPLSTTPWYVQ